jgi:hypothetical protein
MHIPDFQATIEGSFINSLYKKRAEAFARSACNQLDSQLWFSNAASSAASSGGNANSKELVLSAPVHRSLDLPAVEEAVHICSPSLQVIC